MKLEEAGYVHIEKTSAASEGDERAAAIDSTPGG
jgi:hypothetical protein